VIKKYSYNFDFFKWIKKTELVELNEINPEDDPVRPELDNNFRTSRGRKIFGLKYFTSLRILSDLIFIKLIQLNTI